MCKAPAQRSKAGISVVFAAGVLLASLAAPSIAATPPTVPGTTCPVFPADNFWNMDVSRLPVHPSSATWLASASTSTTRLQPDFGPPKDYGIPFVPASAFEAADESGCQVAPDSARFVYGPSCLAP